MNTLLPRKLFEKVQGHIVALERSEGSSSRLRNLLPIVLKLVLYEEFVRSLDI